MCQQWQMFADPMPCPRYVIPVSSFPLIAAPSAKEMVAWLFCGFPRSCDLYKATSKSEIPGIPHSALFPTKDCPFPDPTNIPCPCLGASPKTWQGVRPQTLCPQGLGERASMHESLQCLMKRFTLGNWSWLSLSYLLPGAGLLQSRQGGGRLSTAREPRSTEGSQMTAPLPDQGQDSSQVGASLTTTHQTSGRKGAAVSPNPSLPGMRS